MENKPTLRAIISGGGTGGHIFPALSIAHKLRALNPQTEILFVGAIGRMEMEKVPAEGFRIVGLPISGLHRSGGVRSLLGNLLVPFKVLRSLWLAGKLLRDFAPDIAVGVGGYASAPLLWMATRRGIPTLIQEQNGFAGLTNRILSRRVGRICVAYEGMEKFFPKEKLVLTGNPIREALSHPASAQQREEGIRHYGLDPAKRHLVVAGGSLGSGTLNRAMQGWVEKGCPRGDGVDVIWQCGKHYKAGVDAFLARHSEVQGKVFAHDFLSRMDLALAAADLVISRSGASTVSELCAMGKATLFVPSPNVAEDHQTHNAMALVREGAAQMVRDADASARLMETALALVADPEKTEALGRNALKLARPGATDAICDEISKLAKEKR